MLNILRCQVHQNIGLKRDGPCTGGASEKRSTYILVIIHKGFSVFATYDTELILQYHIHFDFRTNHISFENGQPY